MMEEIAPAVALALSFATPVCENMEITRLKLETGDASLLSDPAVALDHSSNSSPNDQTDPKTETGEDEVKSDALVDSRLIENGPESEEDEVLLVGEATSLISRVELMPPNPISPLNTASETGLSIAVEIEGAENGQIYTKVISFEERSIKRRSSEDIATVAAKPDEECGDRPTIKASVVAVKLSGEMDSSKGTVRSVYELECLPLWGSVSICGHRPEMEDAVVAKTHFMKIHAKMFIGDHGLNGISQSLSHLTSHYFGVYDGHGGPQVANYCRDRLHLALVEELQNVKDVIVNGNVGDTRLLQWEKVFTSCFLKVDDEVGGNVTRMISEGDHSDVSKCSSKPIAPETVGSTAVVAVVCSSHIVVANCGDSRAVLYRGKEAIALSVDHKPNREDEYARIEASGGKVIQWNGHRVFGVLAMSRSIGDRYLKPWIIPDPEVMFVPRAREDECLVMASDGLWDVMTNEEVCEVARKRLLIWHKKNGANPIANRGQGVDPAAQDAAEYLSNLALQRGSKDNISIIVVDLKAQRKFKSKA